MPLARDDRPEELAAALPWLASDVAWFATLTIDGARPPTCDARAWGVNVQAPAGRANATSSDHPPHPRYPRVTVQAPAGRASATSAAILIREVVRNS